ncbi:protein CBFA2T3 isoform X2 [Octopus vulgaris]|uniref:Protein CBFA2T3 isoform X2 n=1 Tax=Octopus vulgaris TaxID=6645 RepID=A0AA36FPF9_OCTVU|nr:protein CBFA2T3 isoform X2 [Octopus vulgaris]
MTGNMLKFGRPVGMNGTHSPLGLNGRTPSPPGSMPNAVSTQQLPPACGARQLSKLKRFLTTLQQFGSDISPDIGERVRTLVLGLVNSHLSIEEFHAKLQEATNFPLRPFVIPFLKANLPLLQRELLHCARMAKQTPQQYLAQNEHILFDTSNSPVESHDSLSSEFNENGKRRSPDRPTKENGSDSHMDTLHSAKRHPSMSPLGNNRISPNGMVNLNSGGPIRLGDISLSRELRERERLEQERIERERAERDRERDRDRHYPSYRPTPSVIVVTLVIFDVFGTYLIKTNTDWYKRSLKVKRVVGTADVKRVRRAAGATSLDIAVRSANTKTGRTTIMSVARHQ